MSKDILKNKKLLTRFARQIFLAPDTPALIRMVAADAAYMVLIKAILNMESSKNLPFFRRLMAFYYRRGLNWPRLCEKLKPAAHALGLSPENSEPLDYYQLLGVAPAATESEIKKAYRKKVRATHPDTSTAGHSSSRAFLELQAAYETLSNPALRSAYNRGRQHLESWYESPSGSDRTSALKQRLVAKRWFFYQVVTIIMLLLLVAIILDYLYL